MSSRKRKWTDHHGYVQNPATSACPIWTHLRREGAVMDEAHDVIWPDPTTPVLLILPKSLLSLDLSLKALFCFVLGFGPPPPPTYKWKMWDPVSAQLCFLFSWDHCGTRWSLSRYLGSDKPHTHRLIRLAVCAENHTSSFRHHIADKYTRHSLRRSLGPAV